MVGEQETGNETYMVNLIRGLASVDHHTSYLLYSPYPDALRMCGSLPANFATRRIWPAPSPLRIPLGLPARVIADAVDILHVTYVAPPVTFARVVATVHDISYLLYPHTFSLRDKVILGTLVPVTLARAKMIITVSESSRQDIVRHYGTTAEKIAVVYQSISAAFHRLSDTTRIAAARARFAIDRPYILAVGNLQPRKNLPRLIQAYARLRQTGTYHGRLVLVGRSKWRESKVYQAIRALGLADEVILTGYILEDELVALYNGADAFVYPSLYEGFGLPPLEAMACGCPVVTGNTSSLPEVVGDAGIMVAPTSVDALAAAIAQITRDLNLRDVLVERGQRRAALFTAEAAARATFQVYRRALSI
jgi:glycosyltransferase involved in cell wall biosynthesis